MADLLNKIKQYKEQQNAYYSILEQKIANLSFDKEMIEGFLSILNLYKKAKVYRDTHADKLDVESLSDIYIDIYKHTCEPDDSIFSISTEEAKQRFIKNYNKSEDVFKVASLSNAELEYIILGLKSLIYNTICNSPFKSVADSITEFHRDLNEHHKIVKELGIFEMIDNPEEVVGEMFEMDSISLEEVMKNNFEDVARKLDLDENDAQLLSKLISEEIDGCRELWESEDKIPGFIKLGKIVAKELTETNLLGFWRMYHEGRLFNWNYTEKEKELLKPLFESPYLDALDDWKAYAKGECNLEDLLPITEVEAEEDAESSITNEEAQEVVSSKIEKLEGIAVLAKNKDGHEINRKALIEWIKGTCSPRMEGTWGCLGLYYVLKHYRFIDSTNDIGKTNFQKLLKSLGIKVPPKFNDAQNMAGCLIIKDDKLIDNAHDIWMDKYKNTMEGYQKPQLSKKGAESAFNTIRIILEDLKFNPIDFII